jgi:hypothetical protein
MSISDCRLGTALMKDAIQLATKLRALQAREIDDGSESACRKAQFEATRLLTDHAAGCQLCSVKRMAGIGNISPI